MSEVGKAIVSKKSIVLGIGFVLAGVIMLIIWLIFFTVNVRTTELLFVPTVSVPTNWSVLSQPFRINSMEPVELLATGIGWALAIVHIIFIGAFELFHRAIASSGKIIVALVCIATSILIIIDMSANFSFASDSGLGAQIMFMILTELIIVLFWKIGLFSIEKGFDLI